MGSGVSPCTPMSTRWCKILIRIGEKFTHEKTLLAIGFRSSDLWVMSPTYRCVNRCVLRTNHVFYAGKWGHRKFTHKNFFPCDRIAVILCRHPFVVITLSSSFVAIRFVVIPAVILCRHPGQNHIPARNVCREDGYRQRYACAVLCCDTSARHHPLHNRDDYTHRMTHIAHHSACITRWQYMGMTNKDGATCGLKGMTIADIGDDCKEWQVVIDPRMTG